MNKLSNVENIKEQINRKKDINPYFSTKENIKGIITDHDHFPYRRFYRGKAELDKAVVIDREAGWRYVDKNVCGVRYMNESCIDKNIYR